MINSAIRKSPFVVSDERAFCFELLGVLHRARFADDVDANLTRILHFLLDALGNFLGENLRAIVGHVVGLDHDAHFAAGLNRVADRKSTRLNSSHTDSSRMPSSA